MPSLRNIFEQSPVNGADYTGDSLPVARWQWPEHTWLQRRMAKIKSDRPEDTTKVTVGGFPRLQKEDGIVFVADSVAIKENDEWVHLPIAHVFENNVAVAHIVGNVLVAKLLQ